MTRLAMNYGICALSALAALASESQAQSGDGVKLEPYTGPPIYLPDTATVVPAARVDQKVNTQKYDNGQVWIERGVTRFSDNSFVSDGVYREFYRNGQPFVEGKYANGEPIGEWTYWRPNGEQAKKVTYRNGQPDGQVELRRSDGTLESRKSYEQGKRTGKWETFDQTGQQLLTEQHFQGGKPTGVWKWWYPSGQQQRETTFENGQLNGMATEWREDGTKRAVVNFQDGKRHGLATQWLADGKKMEQQYKQGAPVAKAP